MKYLPIAGLALASGLVLNAPSAEARPVSYPGGWTVMQMNDGDMSSLHVHYSPTFQDSIGLYTERNWGKDWQFTGLQYNRLVKRWNGENSQANLYFKAAAGHTENLETGQKDLGGFLGVAADWATAAGRTNRRRAQSAHPAEVKIPEAAVPAGSAASCTCCAARVLSAVSLA